MWGPVEALLSSCFGLEGSLFPLSADSFVNYPCEGRGSHMCASCGEGRGSVYGGQSSSHQIKQNSLNFNASLSFEPLVREKQLPFRWSLKAQLKAIRRAFEDLVALVQTTNTSVLLLRCVGCQVIFSLMYHILNTQITRCQACHS